MIIFIAIIISGLLSLLILMQHIYVNKTKREVEDRNACLHIVYNIPYRQKDGKELIIFMKPNENALNSVTTGIRYRPNSFCRVEEFNERDMKFLAQLIKEGYYNVDSNYKNTGDWINFIKSGTIYDGKWKEVIKQRNKSNTSK